jgi:hypothetical protein
LLETHYPWAARSIGVEDGLSMRPSRHMQRGAMAETNAESDAGLDGPVGFVGGPAVKSNKCAVIGPLFRKAPISERFGAPNKSTETGSPLFIAKGYWAPECR